MVDPQGKVNSGGETIMTHKSVPGTILAGAALISLAGGAFAADPASCKTVNLSDVGWTDITATTAATSIVLEGLGYSPDVKVLAVPVTYKSLETGDIDVFLGNWMPTMEGDLGPYRDAGTVEVIQPANLTGAKYTLAVNKMAADAGLKNFGDISKFKDKLGGKIYGIEPGNDGNRIILDMISSDSFGLKGFEVIESSEQGMLSQVARGPVTRQKRLHLPQGRTVKVFQCTAGQRFTAPSPPPIDVGELTRYLIPVTTAAVRPRAAGLSPARFLTDNHLKSPGLLPSPPGSSLGVPTAKALAIGES